MNSKIAWHEMLEKVRRDGREYVDQDSRKCMEITNHLITIENPSDCIDLVREMQKQQGWVYPSPEELKSIITGSHQGAFEYSYVPRLFGGINQIDNFVIPLLKQNSNSRRAAAILYNPETDSKLLSKNIPGLLAVHFRIINKLELTALVRSNDVFIGFPANLFQLRCLQLYVAEKLGIETGAIHVFSGSAHFFPEYEEQYKAVSASLERLRARQPR